MHEHRARSGCVDNFFRSKDIDPPGGVGIRDIRDHGRGVEDRIRCRGFRHPRPGGVDIAALDVVCGVCHEIDAADLPAQGAETQ
ncbi:Uncharacterised protein [Mycobacteroides abscessus subsp. abscessus]|nr:Uncharacterised protein [Mycobacteroides abscessus subsp. abscessus]